jgi:hypothetical protein
VPESLLFNYILTEIESAKRYELRQQGQPWKKEFGSVAAAYFFARSHTESGQGQMAVLNQAGEQCTLFLF